MSAYHIFIHQNLMSTYTIIDLDIRYLIRYQHTVYQHTLYGKMSAYHHTMMNVNIPCLGRCQHTIYQHTLYGKMSAYNYDLFHIMLEYN